jgi:rhodanese-related sulfurtransferase
MTASWLLQLGWTAVYAMPDALVGAVLETGAEPRQVLSAYAAWPKTIAPRALKSLLDEGRALVIDLGTSLQYREGHIPGARWAIRSRLAAVLPALPNHDHLVVTSSDARLAELGALDLSALTKVGASALEGGTPAWRAAGLPLASGTEHMMCEAEDVWYRPYDRAQDREAAMREYLSWEIDLVRQVERDGDARFKILT